MNPAAAGFLAVGAIAAMSSAKAKAAVGIVVPPYVTDAHRKAMEVLARPILNVAAASGSAASQALHRYNAITNGMVAYRGFHVVGRKALTLWTPNDAIAIIERFLDATRAGVAVNSTYRVTNLGTLNAFGSFATDVNLAALSKLFNGERPSDVPLTDLGDAVLAAAQLRNSLSHFVTLTVAMTDAQQSQFNAIAGRLAIEMDACGYLESGKPPPDPTIGGGIAAAAHAVGKFTTGVLGDVAGGVATAVVGSSLFWVAGLAFVAWKVL